MSYTTHAYWRQADKSSVSYGDVKGIFLNKRFPFWSHLNRMNFDWIPNYQFFIWSYRQ